MTHHCQVVFVTEVYFGGVNNNRSKCKAGFPAFLVVWLPSTAASTCPSSTHHPLLLLLCSIVFIPPRRRSGWLLVRRDAVHADLWPSATTFCRKIFYWLRQNMIHSCYHDYPTRRGTPFLPT